MRGSPADEERLRILEDAIDRLRQVAETGTVVVEGAHDLSALDWLGIGGHHVTVHRGQPLAGLVEELTGCPVPIVLLVDWDRTGGRLVQKLAEGLQARVQVDRDCRRRLVQACRSKTLEELPSELVALRRAVHGAERP